mmetsp:Transcript_113929/g.317242  ORF Transcript_113929/g.317242 Transcript_113929/m.317242 type:complete len:648 (-) Transcript_113929:112-2055(-)
MLGTEAESGNTHTTSEPFIDGAQLRLLLRDEFQGLRAALLADLRAALVGLHALQGREGPTPTPLEPQDPAHVPGPGSRPAAAHGRRRSRSSTAPPRETVSAAAAAATAPRKRSSNKEAGGGTGDAAGSQSPPENGAFGEASAVPGMVVEVVPSTPAPPLITKQQGVATQKGGGSGERSSEVIDDGNGSAQHSADEYGFLAVAAPRRPESGKEDAPPQRVKVGAFGDLGAVDRSELDREVYDVSQFYKTTGCAQAVARSEKFINVTLAVIASNAVYLGVDADRNAASSLLEAKWPFVVGEMTFCTFFVFEWLMRFLAFAKKRDCLKDMWFKFDSCLVALMVMETWLMPLIFILSGAEGGSLPTGPLRLLRLLRLTRMARLMRALPELLTMVKGMKVASRAVSSSLLMILLLVYVFAIVMHMLLKDEESVHEQFSSLPRCMWTLLMDGTLLDSTGAVLSNLVYQGRFHTSVAVLIFMFFVMLSAMTVMNMLVGVLCEVVSAVAASEKDEAAIRLMRESVLIELKKFDVDGNQMICREELSQLMNDSEAVEVLSSLQIDLNYLAEMQKMLFPFSDSQVSIMCIMEQMLLCRGDLPVTVQHMALCQTALLQRVDECWERVLSEVNACKAALDSPPGANTMHNREIRALSLS